MRDRDRDVATAFDAQAERFERSPVASDAAALRRLVAFAALPGGTRILDAGCGPGLVAEAFLEAGGEVLGVDLSAEMIERARRRCARFGPRARFERRSLFDLERGLGLGAALSRNVLHHVEDPLAFVGAQAERVAPGGTVVASDIIADPDPARSRWALDIERARDHTHVRSLSPGELVDLFARAGLDDVRLVEEAFELDFDEWFDRGTPAEPKEAVRARLLRGSARGFAPRPGAGGRVAIHGRRALVRGARPA